MSNSTTDLTHYTIPHIVYTTKDPAQQNWTDFVAIQEKFLTLDSDVQTILASPHTGKIIEEIGKDIGLSPKQMAGVARMVRFYYFNEIKKKDFVTYLLKDPGTDKKTAKRIARLIEINILDNSQEITGEANQITVPLSEAIQLYPKIGKQMISDAPLKLRAQADPKQGTVTNWIYDYRDKVESTKRGAIARGKYLFNSTNAKGLSAGDRQKISLVLKSHDEKTPLTIDTTNKQIIFPQTQQRPSDIKKTPAEEPLKAQGSSISQIHSNAAFTMSPHKEEKATISTQKTIQQVIQPQKATHIVGTEDAMTFTSPHALPSEKEKPQQEKDKTPFHMNPIGSAKKEVGKKK